MSFFGNLFNTDDSNETIPLSSFFDRNIVKLEVSKLNSSQNLETATKIQEAPTSVVIREYGTFDPPKYNCSK